MNHMRIAQIKNLQGELEAFQLVIPVGTQLETFKTILARALNTWDKAPAEWKQLADVVIHGKSFQNYYAFPNSFPGSTE